MNIKRKGTAFEYRVLNYLQMHGWKVFRSAGSHSCAELIAYKKYIHETYNLWIQCKCMPRPYLSKTEKADLYLGAKFFDIIPLLVYNVNGKLSFAYMDVKEGQKFIPVTEEDLGWLL